MYGISGRNDRNGNGATTSQHGLFYERRSVTWGLENI